MKASVTLKAVIAIAYFAAAGFTICVGLVRPGVTGYHKAMLEDMVYGKAYMPFVKRQLVPLIVRGVAKTVPAGIHESLSERFHESAVVKKLSLPADYAVETVLTLLVMYGSLVGFLVLLQRFVVMFSNVGSGTSHLIAIATGVLLPVMFAGQMYIYDFTQLLLFTAALILLYQQRWAMFYPVFILACINKETSILLAGVLVLWKGMEIFKSQWRSHVLCQFAIGFGIYFTIGYIFRNNPGGEAEWHLQRNLAMQFSTLAWYRLTLLAAAMIVCLWKLSRVPIFVRRGFIATMGPLLGATLLMGYFDELRDYYEALPFIVVLLVSMAVGRVSKERLSHNRTEKL